jgi:putative ABC transport system substrate-binding protein
LRVYRLVPALVLGLAACDSTVAGRPVLGFAQVSSAAPLDEARDGFFKALADSGYIRDSTIKIIERNAQGDIATLMLIMNEFKQRGVDYVATVSSIATQAALRVITTSPIVFGAVANPYIIGAGKTATDHKPHITGANIPLPLDSAFALAHEAFPKIDTWGTLYDPGDPFAEFYLEMARKTAADLKVKLLTVACSTPGDIAPGIQALKAQGASGIMQIPSVMIGGAFSAVVKAARQAGTPVVTSNTGYKGVPLALGLSFYHNGYDAGVIMIRVMRGESPANIPFQPASRRELVVDLNAAREFGVTIPESIMAKADTVLGRR